MELEDNMASLEINEKKRRLTCPPKEINNQAAEDSSEQPSDDSDSSRRVLRKRFRAALPEKRRVSTKPRKILTTSNLDDIQNYYLDKRIKRLPPSLETIFEEPQQNGTIMSNRRFRRIIHFDPVNTKNPSKIKKRKMKVKSLPAGKRVHLKKLSLDLLLEKLSPLDEVDNQQ